MLLGKVKTKENRNLQFLRGFRPLKPRKTTSAKPPGRNFEDLLVGDAVVTIALS
jgi:hypothetical protein